MDFLVGLVQEYGYYMVFIGTLLEGETIVALAGFAAFQGYLHLDIIIPIAILGAILGDQAFFYLGRYKGRTILAKHPRWHARVDTIHKWMERHQNWLIFGSRFLYGFRAITPIVLGTSRVSGLRFFALNVLGAIVWAHLFVFGGYLFGDAIEHFLGNIKKFEGIIIAGVIILTILIKFVPWWWRGNEKK